MKKLTLYLCMLLCAVSLLTVSGCQKNSDKKMVWQTIYKATYQSKNAVIAAINGNPAKHLDSIGKIYVKDNYIYVNEPFQGIHVIDNTVPTAPKQIAFLSIPGNIDVVIKGNTLYADMYSDLLAIDISNIRQVKVTGKVENCFYSGAYRNNTLTMVDDKVAVSWKRKDTLVEQNTYPGGPFCINCNVYYAAASSGGGTGVAGSMAKMVMAQGYLYALTEPHSLGVIDLSNASAPTMHDKIFAGYDLETVYPFNDKLFLGSSSGVYIFDISSPTQPSQLGVFQHGRACDPVITDGKFAYVTLHSNSWCGGASNELDVLNVEDLMHPVMLKTYAMESPKGLTKDGNLLFICDGDKGVKIMDASKPNDIRTIGTAGSGEAYDVIADNHRLVLVTSKGVYQYSYNEAGAVSLLSLVSTAK